MNDVDVRLNGLRKLIDRLQAYQQRDDVDAGPLPAMLIDTTKVYAAELKRQLLNRSATEEHLERLRAAVQTAGVLIDLIHEQAHADLKGWYYSRPAVNPAQNLYAFACKVAHDMSRCIFVLEGQFPPEMQDRWNHERAERARVLST